MSQQHATMLQDVALKCCERLARPLRTFEQSNKFQREFKRASNRPFYSCSSVSWPKNISEAAGDSVLIQTFVLL